MNSARTLQLSLAALAFTWSQSLLAQAAEDPPSSELRPLSPDRPDITESPNTVDAGHFQLEADIARVTRDEGFTDYGFAHTNLKFGLAHFWDVQLVVESLVGLEGPAGYDWGYGDTTLRTKLNVFGNDSGAFALAVMPWVKFPTAGSRGNEKVEGGLIVPLGIDLPAGFECGLMVEGDWMANEANTDYHLEILNSAVLGHDLVGPLGAYVEAIGVHSTEPGSEYALSAAVGFTYDIDGWLQPDAGVVVGLTEAAEDVSPFVGLSLKL